MRANTMVTLGASAAFGLLSIFLAHSWINDAVHSEFSGQIRNAQSEERPRAPLRPSKPVLVADINFAFGDVITAQSLRLVDMPEDMIPEGSFSDFDALLGDSHQQTVALSRMTLNEPILEYKISGPGGRGSLSSIISDGMRAASIRVDAVAGVGGFVLPGDYVDVLVTREISTGSGGRGGDRKFVTDTLIQNLKVLGTDQNSDTESTGARLVKTVTVEASPEQAQKLTLGMSVGTLSLTLRRIAAKDIAPIAAVSENNLTATRRAPTRSYSAKKPVVAVKPAAQNPVAQVTIIRPGGRDQVSVRSEEGGLPLTDIFQDGETQTNPQTGLAGAQPSVSKAASDRQTRISEDR